MGQQKEKEEVKKEFKKGEITSCFDASCNEAGEGGK